MGAPPNSEARSYLYMRRRFFAISSGWSNAMRKSRLHGRPIFVRAEANRNGIWRSVVSERVSNVKYLAPLSPSHPKQGGRAHTGFHPLGTKKHPDVEGRVRTGAVTVSWTSIRLTGEPRSTCEGSRANRTAVEAGVRNAMKKEGKRTVGARHGTALADAVRHAMPCRLTAR